MSEKPSGEAKKIVSRWRSEARKVRRELKCSKLSAKAVAMVILGKEFADLMGMDFADASSVFTHHWLERQEIMAQVTTDRREPSDISDPRRQGLNVGH